MKFQLWCLLLEELKEEIIRDSSVFHIGSLSLTAEPAKGTTFKALEIAKEAGCKFYLGSDAHGIAKLDTSKKVFENAIDLLELDESDKFHI